ncbi:MAG TPA: ATPase [Caldithrix abyssi]|uniref:ATPase n=1 Tax=Caldithrix abyssi TaxID=187145 RepID=A0A7V4TY47_CALAY|nr:ATPase [Caldithrix abyssi]
MKIAVASGKGGTGKTTLATNLAAFLSERRRVVLIDLDVEEPNSGLFIKGQILKKEDKYKMIPEWSGECSLCGICQDVCEFHAVLRLGTQIMVFPELCHSCYACSELCPESALPMVPKKMGSIKQIQTDGFAFVESRLDIGEEQAVPLIAQTHKYIEANLKDEEIRIYDSPPGTSCPVIEATKTADFVILVTEPTPFGLHDLSLAVETMRELKKDFGVVINRFDLGNDDVPDYCEKEGIPVLARIPNDRHIAELYSQGKLIYKHVPQVETQLQAIEQFLEEKLNGGRS